MAKRKEDNNRNDDARQSRKEVLLARKQAEQTRKIRIGVIIVGSLIGLIIIVGLVNELILAPNRPVATIGSDTISLSDWQDRVAYERAQRIILLENQAEAFGGDVGIIQQLAPQAIVELAPANAETFGQNVLDLMVDEVLIAQAAAERGITVTDEEVERELGASYNYYGGELPTSTPTGTATVQPTPTFTPIPTAVITDVLPTETPLPTATVGPTNTPAPTATPVSEAYFQEQFGELQAQFNNYGVSESVYREVIRNSLLRDRLTDALAAEAELPQDGEQASAWVLSFDTEESANEASALVATDGFLTVWNTVRSLPGSPTTTGTATEVLWRTQAALETSFGADFAEAAFTLPIGETSGLISNVTPEGTTRYYIIQPSGREVRPLSASDIQNAKLQELTQYLDVQVASGQVELTEAWRGRAPTTPILDPIFFAQPTPAPTQPAQPTPAPLPGDEATPAASDE